MAEHLEPVGTLAVRDPCQELGSQLSIPLCDRDLVAVGVQQSGGQVQTPLGDLQQDKGAVGQLQVERLRLPAADVALQRHAWIEGQTFSSRTERRRFAPAPPQKAGHQQGNPTDGEDAKRAEYARSRHVAMTCVKFIALAA
jgi:hypothetical protein